MLILSWSFHFNHEHLVHDTSLYIVHWKTSVWRVDFKDWSVVWDGTVLYIFYLATKHSVEVALLDSYNICCACCWDVLYVQGFPEATSKVPQNQSKCGSVLYLENKLCWKERKKEQDMKWTQTDCCDILLVRSCRVMFPYQQYQVFSTNRIGLRILRATCTVHTVYVYIWKVCLPGKFSYYPRICNGSC